MMSDVDEMDAGPELDAMVARKVMGWTSYESPAGMIGMICRPPVVMLTWWRTDDGYSGQSLPKYSTQIAAAWEVVEKMREAHAPEHKGDSGPWWAVDSPDPKITHDCRAKGNWTAGWRSNEWPDGDGWLESACAPTAPLAICRAALKAVRAQANLEPKCSVAEALERTNARHGKALRRLAEE